MEAPDSVPPVASVIRPSMSPYVVWVDAGPQSPDSRSRYAPMIDTLRRQVAIPSILSIGLPVDDCADERIDAGQYVSEVSIEAIPACDCCGCGIAHQRLIPVLPHDNPQWQIQRRKWGCFDHRRCSRCTPEHHEFRIS